MTAEQIDLFTRPAAPAPCVVVCRVPDRAERFDVAAEGVTYLGAGLHACGGLFERGHFRSLRHLTRAWLRRQHTVCIVTHDDAERTTTVAVPREALVILRSDLPATTPIDPTETPPR